MIITSREREMELEMKAVMKYWMEGEINTFIKVWLSVYISLCCCYFAAKIVPRRVPVRLCLFLPLLSLFLLLPLNLHSIHLGGTTAFFISWLATFKILMLAFNHGPLSHPSISLPRFLVLASLPVRIQQDFIDSSKDSHFAGTHFQKSKNDGKVVQEKPFAEISENRQRSAVSYAIKALLMGLIFRIYDYSDRINSEVLLFIYCFHIYFCLEIIMAVVAAMAGVVLGLELEPQFNEPYLSTSLQDFWGRRWNLTVTRILRPTVYNPVTSFSAKYLGRKWAALPAVMSTFAVSGLMHELMFFNLGRVKPTWEITWFFLLHGACLVAEISMKKTLKGRCQFPSILGTILTVGFVIFTAFWLFFPQLLRCQADVKAIAEYAALGAFAKDLGRALSVYLDGIWK